MGVETYQAVLKIVHPKRVPHLFEDLLGNPLKEFKEYIETLASREKFVFFRDHSKKNTNLGKITEEIIEESKQLLLPNKNQSFNLREYGTLPLGYLQFMVNANVYNNTVKILHETGNLQSMSLFMFSQELAGCESAPSGIRDAPKSKFLELLFNKIPDEYQRDELRIDLFNNAARKVTNIFLHYQSLMYENYEQLENSSLELRKDANIGMSSKKGSLESIRIAANALSRIQYFYQREISRGNKPSLVEKYRMDFAKDELRLQVFKNLNPSNNFVQTNKGVSYESFQNTYDLVENPQIIDEIVLEAVDYAFSTKGKSPYLSLGSNQDSILMLLDKE